MAATDPVSGLKRTSHAMVVKKYFLTIPPNKLICDFTSMVRPNGMWWWSTIACFRLGPAPYRGTSWEFAVIEISL